MVSSYEHQSNVVLFAVLGASLVFSIPVAWWVGSQTLEADYVQAYQSKLQQGVYELRYAVDAYTQEHNKLPTSLTLLPETALSRINTSMRPLGEVLTFDMYVYTLSSDRFTYELCTRDKLWNEESFCMEGHLPEPVLEARNIEWVEQARREGKYANTSYGFSLKNPANWNISATPDTWMVTLTAPQNHANVRLLIQYADPNETIEALLENERRRLRDMYSNVSFSNGASGRQFVGALSIPEAQTQGEFTYQWETDQGYMVQSSVLIFVHASNEYRFTFTALPSTFESFKGTFIQILRSFTFFS